VRLACKRATAEDLDAVEALLDRCQPGMPREEWHQTGTDFHIVLGHLSGNPFLARAIADVMTRLSRPRWLEVWTEPFARGRPGPSTGASSRSSVATNPTRPSARRPDHVRDTRDGCCVR